jgi:hypothetical protein
MKRTICMAMLAAAVLSGCQQPRAPAFQVEQARSFALEREAVWNKVLAFLKANDIAVVRSDPAAGVIQAHRERYQDAGWAYCEPAVVTDRTGNNRRPRRTRVWLDRDLALEVELREAGDGYRWPWMRASASGRSTPPQEPALRRALPVQGRAGKGLARRGLKGAHDCAGM